ncbi:MAG: ParB N-terminal domain-containing protein [Phycisphaerales bacterium]|nr:ParB N-terminal domain-containing protein [Phycisphaerales bacterium]
MKIEMRPTGQIRPYDGNPRVNDKAVDAVAESIRRFGFRQAIVVDGEGVIVCGHTRWKAARRLGLDRVPVHVARDLTPEQVRAYRLADNKTGELAEWDPAKLALELTGLRDSGIDWSRLGFEDGELAGLLGDGVRDGQTDPDQIPEPPDVPTTARGDLWVLGDHRLLCGDSAGGADLDRLMEGATAQLVNTDPPYNVAVEPRSNNAIRAGLSSFPGQGARAYDDRPRTPGGAEKGRVSKMRAKDRPLDNDWMSDEAFARVLGAWFKNLARVLEPGRAFYIWGGYSNIGNYPPALREAGLYFSQAVIWHKMHPVIGRKDFMGDHEWCFYGWREGKGHKFFGPNNASDVWAVKKVSPQSMVHLTEKPVELAVRALQYSSRPGERVLDLFGGSGSTLIAAEQSGRRACLMEIDPAYCDVVVGRWEAFTGRKAERVAAAQPARRAGKKQASGPGRGP